MPIFTRMMIASILILGTPAITAADGSPTGRSVLIAQSREAEKPGKPKGSQHSGGERGTTGMLSDEKAMAPGSNTSAPDAGAASGSQGAAARPGHPSGPPGRRGGIPRGSGDMPTQNTTRASQSPTAESRSGGTRQRPQASGEQTRDAGGSRGKAPSPGSRR
jgi:hypothetical protein